MSAISSVDADKPATGVQSTPVRLEWMVSFAIAAALLVLAEYASRTGLVSRLILPAPSAVARVLYEGFLSGFYVRHIFSTLYALASGFMLATLVAISLAGLLSSLAWLERVVTPFIIAFQSMPKIALAPLIIIWFGFGDAAKVVITASACFFPVLVNAMQGLKIRDQDRYEVFRSLGASRWQLFWRLRLREAIPYVFAGLKIGVIFALIGAVVAEFVGSDAGVGYAMLQSKSSFDIPGVYAALAILMVIGMVLQALMSLIERKVSFWSADVSQLKT